MRYKPCFAGLLLIWALVAAANLPAAEPTLRVMSFNIRYSSAPDGENSWDKRKELLLDVIRKADPDLLGTQEVLAGQFDFLGKQLEGYSAVGVGRDDGVRKGEFSALLYKTDRFEAAESGTFWLSETPDVAGSKSWDSSLPRVATWAQLRDQAVKGREVLFVNTHWDHRGKQARVEAGRIIREWISKHAGKASVVVTGDLNVHDDNEGFLAMVAEDGKPRLLDAYRLAHEKPRNDEATFHGFSGEKTGQRIDFILASPDLSVSEAQIVRTQREGRYPSDHYPVTAVLEYAAKAAK